MLERASSCLESSGRQLLRAPRPTTTSRRMLHSSFWHHGASDLNLPVWWASPVHDNPSSEARPFLDFLYPAKTLALMQNISIYGWNLSKGRRKRQLGGNSVRQFSSNSRRMKRSEGEDMLMNLAAGGSTEQQFDPNTDDPLETLREILSSQDPDRKRLAWDLYSQIRAKDRDTALQVHLLDYLASSSPQFDAHKVLQLFDSLAVNDRQSSSCRAAVAAYLDLGMVGRAIQLYEETMKTLGAGFFATDLVLARTIRDNQWDLTLQVYSTYIRNTKQDGREEDSQRVWDAVSNLSNLPSNVMSFLKYAQQYKHDIEAASDRQATLKAVLWRLVPTVVDWVLKGPKPDDVFIYEMFKELESLGLCKRAFYEETILRILKLPRYKERVPGRKVFIQLYQLYRDHALRDKSYRPSPDLIHQLIFQLGVHESYKNAGSFTQTTVSSLIQDIRLFHGHIAPTTLYLAMTLFARAGDASMVDALFQELRARKGTDLEQRHLSPLLYVHARRVDVAETWKQFKRISEEFQMVPDVYSWNILLHAYSRADDQDGILGCFQNLVQSGTKPDAYSFSPVLDLCARRGDVETVQAFLHQADALDVPKRDHTALRSSLVLAYANSVAMEEAEVEAERMMQDKAAGRLQGPMTETWNILMTTYARQHNLQSTMRVYRRMQELHVSLDTWTYASLMQALISLRQTNAAYKILRVTMPNNNVQVHGFHYALVISGFIAEGQIQRAVDARRRMVQRNVRPTASTRMAMLRVEGLAAVSGSREQPSSEQVQGSLREILRQSDPSDLAPHQPRLTFNHSPAQQTYLNDYVAFLISLYGKQGAFDLCQEMFAVATKTGQEKPSQMDVPVGLLTAFMDSLFLAGDYGEIEQYWHSAKTQADKLTELASNKQKPGLPTLILADDSSPPPDMTFLSQAPAARNMAQNRRRILVPAIRIYIRSLIAQNDSRLISRVQKTIFGLLTDGYIIDNLVWNEFIGMLARSGQLIDAFTACEAYLMPNFVGWRNRESTRRDVYGWQYMDVRPADVRKGTVLPRYATLVLLAAAWTLVKRGDVNVLVQSGPLRGREWTVDVLGRVAPRTIAAIESMPVVPGDRLQQRYLGGL